MSGLQSLDDLLRDELKDIYDAEQQLTNALPKLAKNASNDQLREALEHHLQETGRHVDRLAQIFERLGMPAKGKTCEAMKHLLGEGRDLIAGARDDAARDAVMIASAQKVEHYEIASYGTLRTWANLLGKDEVAALLEDTLIEEKEADRKLSAIAETGVNLAAAAEGDEQRRASPRSSRAVAAADRGRTGNRGRR
jgi:ferritin-like metal-binding protein YciE